MPNLRLGIVGLPNLGKSTLFNALTGAGAAAENYPFCTVDPNVGVVPVPDARLDLLQEKIRPKTKTPAIVTFVDIAGLVKGAAEGEGLGNQFLSTIREVDAIVHVVRCFDNPDVTHVMGEVDPVRDREIINLELGLSDLQAVERRLPRVEKTARTGDKVQRVNGLVRRETDGGRRYGGRPNGGRRTAGDEQRVLTAGDEWRVTTAGDERRVITAG